MLLWIVAQAMLLPTACIAVRASGGGRSLYLYYVARYQPNPREPLATQLACLHRVARYLHYL